MTRVMMDGSGVIVDARRCSDALDLAMAIADTAVTELAPDAAGWWMQTTPPTSTAGLRMSHALSQRGIDADEMRLGSGAGERRLPEAIELLVMLAGDDAVLVIDHIGSMLAALPDEKARKLLGALRAARQRHSGLDLVLVEHPDGPVGSALADPRHPLFRAGQLLRIGRAKPVRFVEDLAVTRAWTSARSQLIGAAAELAGGVPALTWRVIELAPSDGEDDHTRAVAGWRRLLRMTDAQTARQWDLLGRIHPVAQPVVAALGAGLRPHSIPANPKSVNDALNRLRELGVAWQPEARRWALGDPLLAAWVRDHAPPWTSRRR